MIDWFVPGHLRVGGSDELRRARLAVGVAAVGVATFLWVALFQSTFGVRAVGVTAAVMVPLCAAVPFAIRATGWGWLVAHALPFLLFAFSLGLAAASGGNAVGSLFATAAVPIFAVLLGGARAGIAWAAFCCIGIVAVALLARSSAALPLESLTAVPDAGRFRAALLFTLGTTAVVVSYELLLQRARAERRESESRFRALAEEASDIITEWDATGFILYVSPRVEELTGLRPGELLHTHWLEHVARVHPQDNERFRRGMEGVVEGRRGAEVSIRFRHADGSWRWLEFGMRAFRNAEGELRVVSIGRDVTARRQIDALRGR